ncbi:MAG: sn-glycerol-3-phosphate ABC transporter ATP-binding protein UgpC [Thermoleophilia bacterium]|nr:sn-glycerol-3-phosphate ABC transporter ATP-binding protein UgpC [Thermoleophilia bacterium]
MAPVTFSQVSKTYPDGTRALVGFDLEIQDGELVVFVGPSGCGKTTALRMVAGLEEVTEGEILIGDRVVNDLAPQDRDVAMVFQNYALYPHMSVFENIAFPLRCQRMPKREIEERVKRAAALLGLEEQLGRRPRHLSGGQRQRVAMGRAIVRQPQVFLMDEPLSNLDAKLRVQMRGEITRLQEELGVTTIFVTHDQVEAMTMGDRIAVMRKGVLQQQGPPELLYDEPANLFVAEFIGSPAMNLFRGRLEATENGLACVLGEQRLPLSAATLAAKPSLAAYRDRELAVGIRPEHLLDPRSSDPALPRLKGEVKFDEALPPERLVYAAVEAQPVVTEDVLEIAQDVDEAAVERLEELAGERFVLACARLDIAAEAPGRGPFEFAVDTTRLHFFDLDTGAALR